MQTFLPEGAAFVLGASRLDRARLGKQRVEALQIYNALTGRSKGWRNHPATRMWAGYESALVCYTLDVCWEWQSRGYKDTIGNTITDLAKEDGLTIPSSLWHGKTPIWLMDKSVREAVTISHRSNLIRKFPDCYKRYWPDVPDNLPYVWPV